MRFSGDYVDPRGALESQVDHFQARQGWLYGLSSWPGLSYLDGYEHATSTWHGEDQPYEASEAYHLGYLVGDESQHDTPGAAFVTVTTTTEREHSLPEILVSRAEQVPMERQPRILLPDAVLPDAHRSAVTLPVDGRPVVCPTMSRGDCFALQADLDNATVIVVARGVPLAGVSLRTVEDLTPYVAGFWQIARAHGF